MKREPKPIVYSHVAPHLGHDANIPCELADRWLLTPADRRKGKHCVYREDIQRWTIDGTHAYTTDNELVELPPLGG